MALWGKGGGGGLCQQFQAYLLPVVVEIEQFQAYLLPVVMEIESYLSSSSSCCNLKAAHCILPLEWAGTIWENLYFHAIVYYGI
jgi:hypothetical protein